METKTSFKRNKSKKNTFFLFSISLLLIGAIGAFRQFGSRKESSRDLSSYVVLAEKGTLPGIITSSGELQAIRSVNVSPEKQGLLEDLYVKEGEKVFKGQLIARMVGGDYLYRLNELKAVFDKEKASYDRRKELFLQGAISAEQHEEHRNRFLTSQARLEQLEVEGKELMIKAPFDGIITSRYAEPGSYVAPATRASSIAGSTSSSIVELSQGLEVVAKVSESDIGRIQIGQDARFRVDSFPDKRFMAKVSEIAPRASKTDNVTSFEVTLSLAEPSEDLRIGMTADIDFDTGESALSTLIPTVAIVTEKGMPGVLVVGQNKQPRFQKVELGSSNGSKTAIVKGVKPGESIFINMPPWAKTKRD